MHLIPAEIPLPKNEADFERMCANVYGVVFKDPKPKINGRKGQAQGGVDVFVSAKDFGRIGIQCKKYIHIALKWEHVEDEVKKADKNQTPIKTLLIATTSPSDVTLLHKVQLLSDAREALGQFTVEIDFWEDIENHINRFTVLQDSYASHSAGAAYHRQEQQLNRVIDLAIEQRETLATISALPASRDDSTNKFISAQLDRTNELIKSGKFQDALAHITAIGKDLGPFDAHQKARWHLQRGLCLWYIGNNIRESAELFLKAAALYPNDERMASAHIRGLLLNENLDAALEVGRLAIEQFPTSLQVWLSYTNVRVMKGEAVQIDDIPSSVRDEPDMLLLFAIAARRQNNFPEAVRLSENAAAHQEAGFFTRSTALSLVVENAVQNPIAAMYGLLPKSQLDALNRVTAMFEPRHEKLWSIQSKTVEEVAAHLGFAFILKREPKGAIEVVTEAATHGMNSKELLRVHIHALSDLERNDEVLQLGRACLKDLTQESIVVVAELAANRGDVKFLEDCIAQAKGWSPANPETVNTLSVIRWRALECAGMTEQAIREIAEAKIATSNNFILACAAARLLYKAQRPIEADELIDTAKSLINEDNPESDRLMLADMLYSVERWLEAAALYEPIVDRTEQLSGLHTRLLTCYVEADSRKKAKKFLSNLPEGWVENDAIRHLAIDLGQKASDWTFLLPLTKTQVHKAPTEAISWLFKLHVARHVEAPAAFQDMVRHVPEELSGSIRNIAQLAALELRYDEYARALRRLYRLLRQNFDEPEAFSAYFMSLAIGPTNLPLMEEQLPKAVAGSSLILMDDVGHELQVVIDPLDVGVLSKRDGFLSPDSSEAATLLGAEVGQIVSVPAKSIGSTHNYTVKAIQSAYRRLVQITHERATSFGGLPYMKCVPVGTSGDGTKDLARVHEEIKRSSEVIRQIFEAYGGGSLTLSGLAKMCGKSPIDVVTGWPSDAPPIFIDLGILQDRDDALATLGRTDASYVTDVLTLVELVNFGIPEVLAALPKIYISPVTMGILEDNVRNAEEDKSFGSAIDVGGQLGFIEHDASHRERRIAFARKVMDVAKKYCTVQPAYGELTPAVKVPQFVDILQEEEHEMLLLAKDCNATILTLDGRLRMLAKLVVEVNGVWPQALLMRCLATGNITPGKSSEFTIKQFLANRKFVSLSSLDLIWMVMQGDSYIQRGIQAFKQYLESPDTEFASSTKVALDFLSSITRLNISLGVLGELLVHICEPIFRRKDCPAEFYEDIEKFAHDLPIEIAGVPNPYFRANFLIERRIRSQQKYLAERIDEARKRSNNPIETRPIAVRVLFCSKIPQLFLDKSEFTNTF